jgi:hypothetical protein
VSEQQSAHRHRARVWGLRRAVWCAIGSRAALLAVATAIYLALAVAVYLAYPTRFSL